jgi:Effector protein
MAQSDVKPQDEIYIPWQQVISLNSSSAAPTASTPFSNPLGDVALLQTAFTSTDRAAVEKALDSIQKTENGQLLFQALLAKQTNQHYDGGSQLNRPVSIGFGIKSEYLETSKFGSQVTINFDEIDKLVHITPEGKRIKPTLDDTLFHELTHAADADTPVRRELANKWVNNVAEYGVMMRASTGDFTLTSSLPQNKAFIATLPSEQKEAYQKLIDAADANMGSKAFNALFEEKLPILLENPILREQYETLKLLNKKKMMAEDLAVDRTNAYIKESRGDKGYTRGSYHQDIYHDAYIGQPAGEVIHGDLTPRQRRQNEAAQQEWVKQYGEHVTSPNSELRDFEGVRIPDPKGREIENVLPPLRVSMDARPIDASQPFTPSASPKGAKADVTERPSL